MTNASAASPGPYHGSQEGHARIQAGIAWTVNALLLLSPWVMGSFTAHRQHHGLLAAIPLPWFSLFVLDLQGIVAAVGFWQVWSRLCNRIALGGPDASFLDKLRLQVASLYQGLMLLLLFAVTLTAMQAQPHYKQQNLHPPQNSQLSPNGPKCIP